MDRLSGILSAIGALAMTTGPGITIPATGGSGESFGAHWQAITLAIGQICVMAGLLIITGHQYWIGQPVDDFLKGADLMLFTAYIVQRVNVVKP